MELKYNNGNLIFGIYENEDDDKKESTICTVLGYDPFNNFIWVENLEKIEEFTELKPIPLSVDWLKKSGYKQLKRIEKTYSLSSFEDNSSIYFTGVRFIHIQTGTHLEWVHELQNLIFCLQKQELKFI
jgi:hypothetical protein